MSDRKRPRGRPPYDDVLTPMEWRVLHAAQHGSTNREIAASLGISTDGVKYHMANVLAKLSLPNIQALKSWFQAPRNSALAQNNSARPQEVAMSGESKNGVIKSLGQVSRSVRSLEESIEFYQGKLGIPHLYSFDKLAFFDLSGTRLFLNQTENPKPDESLLYMRVEDIVKACAELASSGVEISNAPHLIHTHEDGTEEWMAFMKDPEGRALGLMSLSKKAG